jgi:putative FmdB family regulatory protein
MPLYEYACRACGARFETIRKADERLLPLPCPTCAAQETSLCLSTPGFVGAASGGPSVPACGMPAGGCCGGGACAH